MAEDEGTGLMGVREDVMESYPTLAFLLGDPEIGPLLTAAVDPNQGYSPQTFQAKLYQTNWWKNQSDTQREWLIKSQTDKGTANQQRSSYWAELDALAKRMGVSLTNAEIRWISEIALAQGWSLDSAQLRQAIVKQWRGTDYGAGQIGADSQTIRALATGQFFRPMSTNEAHELARRVAAGTDTLESIQTRLRTEAAERFPHLRDRLGEGMTVAQIVEPYRQIVAEELEMGDVSEVNMSNPTWRKLLGVNQGDGKMRMMTESEVISMARSQDRWWKTSRGRQADASMTTSLMGIFGKRASSAGAG